MYYGITDASVDALVGDGHHGQVERIQDLRCQACEKRVSGRRGTALYGLKTASWRVSEVLSALAEGLDVGAAVRVFGHAEGTILRWRTRAGMHGERMHERFFCHLALWHVQLDELKTRLREKGREVWVALDVQTKVIPSLAIGPRTQTVCNALIHGLCGVLAPGCVPVFTSDGLNMYFYALTAHPSTGSGQAFGSWQREEGRRKPRWVVSAELLYGQVKKFYHRRRVVRVEYRMQCYRSRTPAMAAGITGHRWTASKFLSYPLPVG